MARKERLDLARLVADNDQDRMEARRWMAEATSGEIARVWYCIQQRYDDPAMEIMSRFAQLALGEMLAERLAATP